MIDFQDRTLFLSGATGGIGRSISHLFSQFGANIFLTDLDEELLSKLEAEFDEASHRVAIAKMDVSCPTEVEAAIKRCEATFGGIELQFHQQVYTYPWRLHRDGRRGMAQDDRCQFDRCVSDMP